MNRAIAWFALLHLLLPMLACTKSEPTPESAACCTDEGKAHSHVANTASQAGATSGSEPVPLSVRVHVEVSEAGLRASVQNRGDTQVSLRGALTLERRDGERWLDVPNVRWPLRDCATAVDACAPLAPGAELLPPVHPYAAGQGPCGACEGCAAIGPGTYRVAIAVCDGRGRSESEAFAVAAASHGGT